MLCLEEYRDILLENGFEEASKNPYHFWKILTEKTAYIINLKQLKDGIGIVYGVMSTAVFWNEADWKFQHEFGRRDSECNLRDYIEITSKDDEKKADIVIRKLYEEYRLIDKDTLLNRVKDLRKQFIQEITNILKPLGFRKKGNQWRKNLTDDIVLQFWADKSQYSDLYYFEINIFSQVSSRGLWCYSERLKNVGTELYGCDDYSQCLFDWQLQSKDELREIVNRSYKEELLPLIETDLCELGKKPFVWERCICPRDCCEQCWVEKNLWEAKQLIR